MHFCNFLKTTLIRVGHAGHREFKQGFNFVRFASSAQHVSVQKEKGIATVTLQRPPVNSLNLDLFQQITNTITELENSKDVKGLVLTSAFPGIFSAGLDILEMYNAEKQRFLQFWTALQDCYMTLYSTPLVTLAAVNGHAIAGGFQLMVSCDYRVAVDGPFKLGLNETLLGLSAPEWFQQVLVSIIGHRRAEVALQLGQMFSPEQALKLGILDEVASNEEELKAKISSNMAKWLKISESGRQATKKTLRSPSIDYWKNNREKELQNTMDYILQDQTQKILKFYLDQMKKKQ